MLRVVLILLALGAFACGSGRKTGDSPSTAQRPRPTLRIAFLTDIKGYLEPCGCTQRPLGGVQRLGGALDRLRSDNVPTAVVATGDLFLREPLGDALAQQEQWQAEALVDILRDLGVAAMVPGRGDRRRGEPFLAELKARARTPFLGDASTIAPANERTLILSLGETKVGFLGVTDANGETLDALATAATTDAQSLRSSGARMVVALLRGDRRVARAIGQVEGIDFVLHGGLDAEHPEPPTARGSSFVLEGGRQGQRLAVLELFLRNDQGELVDASDFTRRVSRERLLAEVDSRRAQLARWEQDGTAAAQLEAQRAAIENLRAEARALEGSADLSRGNAFVFEPIELAPGTPERAAIKARMDALAIRVNDHNREAFADLLPPPAPEGTPSYVGSQACASCHGGAMGWWRRHAHGRAYATLTERHHEFDLQCVGCHVTGYGRPGGSTVTHNLEGALVNVGCESCHGPGSEHVANPSATPRSVRREVPENVCTGCHSPEHSDHFDYETYLRQVVVPGHGMPTGGSR